MNRYSLYVARAVQGETLLFGDQTRDEAMEKLQRISFGHRALYQAGHAKAACQLLIKDEAGEVVYRCGSI